MRAIIDGRMIMCCFCGTNFARTDKVVSRTGKGKFQKYGYFYTST
jgi:hypothetical protein